MVAATGNPKIFLVVGECGDGKSTLINGLRDKDRSGEPTSGLCSRGVTKSIEAYVSWWRFNYNGCENYFSSLEPETTTF